MKWRDWLLVPPMVTLALGLGYTVLSLPDQAHGLQAVVAGQLEKSGVSNPVTAVLLNFRGYDTLLEMVALILALLGVWSLGTFPAGRSEHAPGPVLDTLTRLLSPVLIIVSAYLLWAGAHAPGGAFQAGAILGAAGVLWILSRARFQFGFTQLALRLALVAGVVAFMAVAVLMLLTGRQMLEYPVSQAGNLILFIEAIATVSIGVTLAALFLGTEPPDKEQP